MSLRIKAVVDKFFQELKEALDAEIQDRIMKEREMESYIEEREREVAEREAAWKAELSRREAEIADQEANLQSEIDEYEREKDFLVGGTASNLGDLAGAFEDLRAEPKEYKDTLARMRTTMAHHFLVLLNTANEDNLFKIKGVASDRVQLILTLRQVSPIKTLDDVARICPATLFSERQVQRLLRDLFIALYCVETEELEDFQVQMRADMDDEFLDFLNKAPWANLLAVYGIGHKMADKILEHRPSHTLYDFGLGKSKIQRIMVGMARFQLYPEIYSRRTRTRG